MARNTILLKGNLGRRYEEGRRGVSVVKPGMLIDVAADGTIIPHATAAQYTPLRIAVEEAFIGGTINTTYATAGDLVRYLFLDDGEVAQMILKAGQNVAIGARLVSNGDGTLRAAAGVEVPLVQAEEAVNAVADSFIAVSRV